MGKRKFLILLKIAPVGTFTLNVFTYFYNDIKDKDIAKQKKKLFWAD